MWYRLCSVRRTATSVHYLRKRLVMGCPFSVKNKLHHILWAKNGSVDLHSWIHSKKGISIDDFCSELFSRLFRLFILEAGWRKDFITEKGPVGLLFESHYLLRSIVKAGELLRIQRQICPSIGSFPWERLVMEGKKQIQGLLWLDHIWSLNDHIRHLKKIVKK